MRARGSTISIPSGSSGSRTTPSSSSTSAGCPTSCVELRCRDAAELAEAIRTLAVRGAPAIGVAAAYGIALAAASGEDLDVAYETLAASRPTAVNLRWALDEMRADPTPRARPADPRGRGRAVPARWARTRRSWCRPPRRSSPIATRAASRPAATAPRSARSGLRRSAAGSRTSGSTRRGRCCRARA